MAIAAFWLAFYLVPFLLLVLMPGWRSRAICLLLVAGLVGGFLFWLRGIDTLAFGVGATAVLAVISGVAGSLVAWLAEAIFRRLMPGRRMRLAAAGIGMFSGLALEPPLKWTLAALFAAW